MSTSALSIPPSTWFGGSDGQWSTFSVQVAGLSPVYLLPASSTSATWVVSATKGCLNDAPETCAFNRGGTVDLPGANSRDFSWINGNLSSSRLYLPFDPEASLQGPYNLSTYIFDGGVGTVTLGGDRTLAEQFIIDYWATTPYIGLLGLRAPPNIVLRDGTQTTLRSVLGALASSGHDPTSEYWGYTAGAYYRSAMYPGSLTFGGYDAARRDMKNILTADTNVEALRDLIVDITQVTIRYGSTLSQPVTNRISAYINTVVPEMWLPMEICLQFESAFGLVWNDTYSRYLISNEQHEELIGQNATIDIDLSAKSPDPSKSVTITFSYKAFYQPLTYPLTHPGDPTTLYYFPLRRASAVDQYTLGRVFLQEAYLAVDYKQNQFFLSQALFPADERETKIVTIEPNGHRRSSGVLSTGAIVGVVIGVGAVLALVVGALWWFVYRPRRARRQQERQAPLRRDFDGYYGNNEKDTGYSDNNAWAKREMDASQPARGSIASRAELPSPPLPQYSPGSPGRGWPNHRGSVEAEGDYITARRSTGAMSPVELSAEGGIPTAERPQQ